MLAIHFLGRCTHTYKLACGVLVSLLLFSHAMPPMSPPHSRIFRCVRFFFLHRNVAVTSLQLKDVHQRHMNVGDGQQVLLELLGNGAINDKNDTEVGEEAAEGDAAG